MMPRLWFIWPVLILMIASLRWIVPGRWSYYLVRSGELVTETADCAKANEMGTSQVSQDNAEKVFREGYIQTLIGADDGCFRLHQRVLLTSIRRTAKSRTIFFEQEWSPVVVSMVIKTDFKSLEPARQKYAEQKFGQAARAMTYHLVTFAIDRQTRPQPPPLVPLKHPNAISISRRDLEAHRDATVITLGDGPPNLKNGVKLSKQLLPAHLADPEAELDAHRIMKFLEKISPDLPVTVIGDSDANYRGYNLVSLLQLQGFKYLRWLPETLKSSDRLPKHLPGLKTVDCWQAIELIRKGARSSTLLRPADFPFVWFGRNETDFEYLKSIQSQISPQKLARRKTGIEIDYWFPGGQEQMNWCLKYANFGTAGFSDDM